MNRKTPFDRISELRKLARVILPEKTNNKELRLMVDHIYRYEQKQKKDLTPTEKKLAHLLIRHNYNTKTTLNC